MVLSAKALVNPPFSPVSPSSPLLLGHNLSHWARLTIRYSNCHHQPLALFSPPLPSWMACLILLHQLFPTHALPLVVFSFFVFFIVMLVVVSLVSASDRSEPLQMFFLNISRVPTYVTCVRLPLTHVWCTPVPLLVFDVVQSIWFGWFVCFYFSPPSLHTDSPQFLSLICLRFFAQLRQECCSECVRTTTSIQSLSKSACASAPGMWMVGNSSAASPSATRHSTTGC